MQRAASFELDHNLDKLTGEMNPHEWLMTPQTVNAYYHPLRNEIVFPAAILQPPFFGFEADDAVNYGGIGAVIGHEIGHGFDDQGSTCDGDGRLRDWWTADDRQAFEERTRALIGQFAVLEPAQTPGHTVNGELTIGENIGDLGGLGIAIKAWRLAGGDQAADIDGYCEQAVSLNAAANAVCRPSSTGPNVCRSSGATRSCATSTTSTSPSASGPRTPCGSTPRSGSPSGDGGVLSAAVGVSSHAR